MTMPSDESQEKIPRCWACQDPATHYDTGPLDEYTCDEHAISIDAERFRDSPEKPDYALRAQKLLEESLDRWHDDDWSDEHKHLATQRAMLTIKHEVDDELE